MVNNQIKEIRDILFTQQSLKLFKQNKNNKDVKITDLFIVINKNHDKINFFKKKSFYGKWLLFKKKVADLLHPLFHTTSQLQESNNEMSQTIKACMNKMNHINIDTILGEKNDFKLFLNELARAYNIKTIEEVAIDVIKNVKPELKGPPFKGYPFTATVDLINPEQSARMKDIYEKLIASKGTEIHDTLDKMMVNKFSPEEKNEIASYLFTYANKWPALHDAAEQGNRALFLELLKEAMLSAFELAEKSAKEKTLDHLDNILRIIQKEIPSYSIPNKTPELNNLALILGDSFIDDTKYEGDINSRIYSGFFVQYMRSHQYDSPNSLRLIYNLDHIIDFRSNDLNIKSMKKEILDRINSCPPGPKEEKSCVFAGGWTNHAILYEIERKKEGKYVFRVFNQGSGILNHAEGEQEGRTKYSYFCSIDDIDEEDILRPTFLAQLKNITTKENGQDYLYNLIFSQLGTKEEPIEDYQFTFGQRSGTCTFQSFWAYIKHKLGPIDSKRVDIEYKTFMLKQYLPELQKKADKKINEIPKITWDSTYNIMNEEYQILNLSLQKFARDLENKLDFIDEKTFKEANSIILEYKLGLKRLEKNMRLLSTTSITNQNFNYYDLNYLPGLPKKEVIESDKKQIPSETFSSNFYKNLALIDKIQPDLNGEIDGKSINEVLTLDLVMVALSSSFIQDQKESKVLLNRIFKKIGAFENYQKIKFANPNDAIQLILVLTQLSVIFNKMRKTPNQVFTQLDQVTFLIAASYLSKCIFHQLPIEERIIQEDLFQFVSYNSDFMNDLRKLYPLDPYWARFLGDFDSSYQNSRDKIFDKDIWPDHVNKECDISKYVDSIIKYWDSKPQSFHDQVMESIKIDRAKQEKIIIDGIEEADEIIKESNEKINEMLNSVNYQSYELFLEDFEKVKNEYYKLSAEYNNQSKINPNSEEFLALKKRYDELKKFEIIDKLSKEFNFKLSIELDRAQIREKIENDSKYWPKGWENNEQLTSLFKAKFIFGNRAFFKEKLKVDDVLPNAFRFFFLTGTITKHAFYKDPLPIPDYGSCYDVKKKKLNIDNFLLKHEKPILSLIHSSFTKEWQDIFSNIDKFKNNTENSAPMHVEEILSKSGKKLITSDELREIFACLRAEVRIHSVLSYFLLNWEKLADQNWMILLTFLLFESNILSDALKSPNQHEQVKNQIEQFFNKVKQNAIIKGDFSLIGNLMIVKGCFRKLLIEQSDSIEDKENYSALDEVEELLKIGLEEKNESHQSVLLEGLAAYCGQVSFIPGCKAKDPDLAILVNLLRKQTANIDTPLPLRSNFALDLDAKINEYFTDYKGDIDKVVTKRFQEYLKLLFPSITELEQDKKQVDTFKTADKNTEISLSSGLISSDNPLLWKKFVSRPSPELTQALLNNNIYTPEEMSEVRCRQKGNITYIYHPKTVPPLIYTGIRFLDREIFYAQLEIKGKKEWYITFYSDSFKRKNILEKSICFGRESNYFVCEPNTCKVLYQLVNQKKFNNCILFDMDSKLILGKAAGSNFTSFEDPKYSNYWINEDNDLKKIEFPRMNLNFIWNEEKGLFESKEHKGWFISKDQYAPHHHIGMGVTTGYLSLENAIGQKKVLFPIFPLLYSQSIINEIQYDYKAGEKDKISYVEYDLENNTLNPKTLEARYYLSHLYLAKGALTLAENLLFNSQAEVTNRALSVQEREILEQIIYDQGVHRLNSPSILCRLHAFYLLERDSQTYRTEELEEITQKIKIKKFSILLKLYQEYLTRLGHVKPLDQKEEVVILETLSNYRISDTPIFSNRKAKLMKLNAGPLPVLNSKLREWKVLTKDKIQMVKAENTSSMKKERYEEARKNHEFPFEWFNEELLSQGIKDYYTFLSEEAESCTAEEAKKNGLLSLCSLAALKLNNHPELAHLLEKLNTKIKGHKEIHGRILPSKKPIVSLVDHEVQDLNLLNLLQSSKNESIFLTLLRQRYLETQPAKPLSGGMPTVKAKANLFSIVSKDSSHAAKKIKKDLKAARSQLANTQNYTEIKSKSLKHFEVELTDKIQLEKQSLLRHEQLILSIVHSALMSSPRSSSQFRARKRHLPTLNELAILSSKINSDEALKKLYPELSSNACTNLRSAMKKYLIQKQFVQHLDRSIRKLEIIKEEKDSDSRRLLLNDFGKSLDAKREYQETDPLAMAYLTLETILDIKLRKDQVQRITDFYNSLASDTDLVVQMIMGAGKTSIIQPLLALLFSKEGALSSVTLPPSLYPSVVQDLSNLLGSNYSQLVFADTFSREQAKTPGYLKTFLNRLNEAISRGAIFVLTPQHKFAIYSSFKEALYNSDKLKVEILAQICHLLQISEYTQIDEIDMIMDPKIIYKFPVGVKTRINSERAEAITDMMFSLINDPALTDRISLDFATQLKKRQNAKFINKGTELTEELFETTVKPKLVESAFMEFEKIYKKPIQGQLKNYVEHFLGQTTPYDQDIQAFEENTQHETMNQLLKKNEDELIQIAKDQKGKKIDSLIAQKLLFNNERNRILTQELSIRERECLGALAKSISILKNKDKSLFKEAGVHYSNDPIPGIYTARPHISPHNPKSSIPSDPYEMLIMSIQNVIYNGIPKSAVIKMMKQFQKTAVEDVKAHGGDLTQTEGYKKFKYLLGKKADKFYFFGDPPSEKLINLLQKRMNADESSLREFLRDYVFPQIGFYEKSIETTPQAMVGLSHKTFGYTGTINPGVLARKMQAIAEEGTDGKTITVLANKIAEGTSNIETMDTSQKSYLDQVATLFKNKKDFHVFIDSGNWLKEETTEKWASKLLEEVRRNRNNIQGIVYPNTIGEWQSLEYINGKLETIPMHLSNLKPHERLTIIPSKHETGTNILQVPTAKAFVSIRKEMTLRDALQSVFRNRQILEGQQITFGISKEVNEHIALKLLQNLIKNEVYQNYFQGNIQIDQLPETNSVEKWIKNVLAISPTKKELLSNACSNFDIKKYQEYLWIYLLENQTEDQFDKNVQSLDHKMTEVLEKPIRMVLTDPKIFYEDKQKLFNELVGFFVPTQIDSPFTEMTKTSHQEEIMSVVKNKEEKLLKIYSDLKNSKNIPEEILTQIDVNINALYQKGDPKIALEKAIQNCLQKEILPKFVKSTSAADIEQEEEQEVEQEVEQEAQIDVNAQFSLQNLRELPYKPFKNATYTIGGYVPRELLNATFNPISNLFKSSGLSKLLLGLPLEYSPNLFLEDKVPSNYYLPGHYILMMKDGKSGKTRYVLLSHEDASEIRKGMKFYSPYLDLLRENSVNIFTFDGDIFTQCGKKTEMDKQEAERMILFGKILTGKINFKKSEIELLDKLIDSSDDPEKLVIEVKEVFESVLALKEGELKKYPLSPLSRYFYKKLGGKNMKLAS